jgi:MFS transporter, PPP family, 3-phenylpropionic acid transporter
MNFAVPDFLLFTVVGVFSVYFPLFLREVGYSATQIGVLFGIFNAAGIVIPLALTPAISKSGKFTLSLFVFAVIMTVVPVPLFRVSGFAAAAVCMVLYAAAYKGMIPVSDALINETIAGSGTSYGQVRVCGSAGFVAMSLVMQHFVKPSGTLVEQMVLWMSIPAALFGISISVWNLFFGSGIRSIVRNRKMNAHSSEQKNVNPSSADGSVAKEYSSVPHTAYQKSTRDVLVSFGFEYWLILFVVFMQYMGMVPANQFLSIYVKDGLHSNASGFLWALNATCEIPFMFLSGRFIKHYGSKKLIIICTAAVILRMSFYALIPNIAGAVLGQMMHSLTFGLFYPSCIMYFAQAAKGNKKALMVSMSIFSAVSVLANVIGSPLGGVIIDSAGYCIMFALFALFPISALIVYFLARRKILRAD